MRRPVEQAGNWAARAAASNFALSGIAKESYLRRRKRTLMVRWLG
jgi:hypothetical protein